jgi:hypothetical protein
VLVNDGAAVLDNHGISTHIAENVIAPGSVIGEKNAALIRESIVLVALLTAKGLQSEWVLNEVQYARDIRRPRILLVDHSLIQTRVFADFEVTPTDYASGAEGVVNSFFAAFDDLATTQRLEHPPGRTSNAPALILAAGLAGVAGLALGSGWRAR